MKYYIPTSTLNYNAILSTESISPAGFYKSLGFGYSRFVDIFDGKSMFETVLFDKLCQFSRPESEVEDHPMVVEIELTGKQNEAVVSYSNGRYGCARTLYFTPYNVRFIFFDRQDQIVTNSLSDSSLETKFTALYQKCQVVLRTKEMYDFASVQSEKKVPSEEMLDADRRINKAKGSLFGYYVGALLSTTKTGAERWNILNAAREEYAMMIANRNMSNEQIEKLKELSLRWRTTTGEYRELNEILNNTELEERVMLWVQKWYPSSVKKTSFVPSESEIRYVNAEEGRSPLLEKINGMIDQEEFRQLSESKKKMPNPDVSKWLFVEGELMKVPLERQNEIDILKQWVNDCLQGYDKNYYLDRLDFATALTHAAKDVLGNEWNTCAERDNLNTIRKLVNGESVQWEFENNLMSSVAAVVLAGDSWEKLLSFMRRKGMYYYHLAFSIWGELWGFANMPRDFTDQLFEVSSEYTRQIYSEFYGQLFGEDIVMVKHETINDDNFFENLKSEQKEKNDGILPDKGVEVYFDKSRSFQSLSEEAKKYYINKVMGLNVPTGDISPIQLRQIAPMQRTKTKWEDVIKELFPKNRISRTPKKPSQMSMFSDCDADYIKECFSSITANEIIIARLIENWKYVIKKKKDKAERLSFFINLCKKEGRGESKSKSLYDFFSKETADRANVAMSEKYSSYYE